MGPAHGTGLQPETSAANRRGAEPGHFREQGLPVIRHAHPRRDPETGSQSVDGDLRSESSVGPTIRGARWSADSNCPVPPTVQQIHSAADADRMTGAGEPPPPVHANLVKADLGRGEAP